MGLFSANHLSAAVILLCAVYYIPCGRFVQLLRVGSHDHLQHLLCPKPVLREAMMKAVHTCPSPSPGGSQGCILPPQVPPYLLPTGVTWWDTFCCSFLEEDTTRTNCIVEEDIYNVLGDIIEEDDVVLEVGSRYGAVSCALSEAMGNNGKLITVEADPDTWDIHQYNKLSHSCSSYSVCGVLGEEDMVVLNTTQHYAKRTSADPEAEGVTVKHFTWDDIEAETGLTINTLVIDCEGCLFDLIDTYKHKFKQVNKIILENDENFEEGFLDLVFFNGCGDKCQQVNSFFKSEGFQEKLVIKGLHYHYVFMKDP